MISLEPVFIGIILVVGVAFILYQISLRQGPSTRGAVFLAGLRHKGYSFAEMINYEAIVSPGVIALKNGSLMGGWQYRGQDLDSASEEELEALVQSVNSSLLGIGSGWCLHIDAIRTPVQNYPQSHFPHPTTQIIDDERRAFAKRERSYYDASFYLCLSWSPDPDVAEKVKNTLFASSGKAEALYAEKNVKYFNQKLDSIQAILGSRLGIIRRMDETALLTYIYRCMVGSIKPQDFHSITPPTGGYFLDDYLALCAGGVQAGMEPKVGRYHIRVLTPGLPHQTYPGVLDFLNSIASAYRWNTRYILLSKDEANKKMELKRKHWSQRRRTIVSLGIEAFKGAGVGGGGYTNRDADEMVEDASVAITDNQSDLVRYGYISSHLILHHDNPRVLESDISKIREFLGTYGFPCVVEDINAFEAFLGSLPGDTDYNVRRHMVSTRNLADIIPTTSVWIGEAKNKHLDGPPLAICRTRGSAPFRYVTHIGDVGHTLLAGPTGAGKTIFLNLVSSQFFRYPNSRVVVFDYKYGAYVLAKACGGVHYDLGGPFSSDVSFCPLAGIDDENERAWAAEYVEDLIRLQISRNLAPSDRETVSHALSRLASDPSKEKTLSNLMIYIQDEDLRQAISYYTQGKPLGMFLDSVTDSLQENRFTVFEMENLMRMGPKIVIPVLLYIFHKIDQKLTRELGKEPTLIVMDEAWVFLGHDIFSEKIREWLKVLRSKNAFVIFSTQNLSDIANSPIKDVVFENAYTKIFLPNPSAKNESSMGLYRSIGLEDRQIDIIAQATPKKEYYYSNNMNQHQLFELNLGPVQLAFLGSSLSDVRAIHALISRLRQEGREWEWPAVYLDSLKLADAAKEWREKAKELRIGAGIMEEAHG